MAPAARGWRVAATVLGVLLLGSLALIVIPRSVGRTFTTGADETIAERLPDGSKMRLEERSEVKLDRADEQWIAIVVSGSAIFDVPPDAPQPLIVRAARVTAVGSAGAKFRVSIDLHLEFELYEGFVQVVTRGANGLPAVITLKKGVPSRVPIAAGEIASGVVVADRARSLPIDELLARTAVRTHDLYHQDVCVSWAELPSARCRDAYIAPISTMSASRIRFAGITKRSL